MCGSFYECQAGTSVALWSWWLKRTLPSPPVRTGGRAGSHYRKCTAVFRAEDPASALCCVPRPRLGSSVMKAFLCRPLLGLAREEKTVSFSHNHSATRPRCRELEIRSVGRLVLHGVARATFRTAPRRNWAGGALGGPGFGTDRRGSSSHGS